MDFLDWIVIVVFFGILIALHEFGHCWVARKVGMKVVKYSIGFFKPIFSWTSHKSGITYQLGALPLGGFVQIKGMNPFEEGAFEDPDSYQMASPWKRALVIVAGPLANLVIAWVVLFGLVTMAGGIPEPINEAKMGTLVEDAPAAQAGLEVGDRIVAINGEKVTTWVEMVAQIEKNPGKKTLFLVERAQRRFPVTLVPYDVEGVGKIGVNVPTKRVRMEPGKAAVFATLKCIQITSDTLSALWGLISRTRTDVKASGPAEIMMQAKQLIETSFVDFMSYMAYISLALFLFNLLPVPALDGGRTMFLIYELVTRKRINKKLDAMLNTIFFFLFIGMLVIISIKEVFFK